MSKITPGNKTIQADSVHKAAKGQEAEAMKAAQQGAADELQVKMGGDTFAASGRALDQKGVKAAKAENALVANDKFSFKDVLKKPFGKVAGVGAAIAVPSAAGFLLSLSPAIGTFVPGMASIAPALWAGGAIFGGVVLAAGAIGLAASSIFGAGRKADT